MLFTDQTLLSEARSHVVANLEKGTRCPCCDQRAQRYKRRINSGMAWGLCVFYSLYGGTKEFVHVPSQTDLSRLGGDWAKLALWGLIEEKPSDREDGGPHAGWWRLTALGVRFVAGQCRVPKVAYVYDGAVQAMSETETTSIQEALGKKFSWRDLLRGVELPPMPDPTKPQLGLFRGTDE